MSSSPTTARCWASPITVGTAQVTVPNTGIYHIYYGVNITAGVGASIAIAVNGTVDASTNINLLVATGEISGDVELALTAADVLTLRNNSAVATTLDATPGVGAQMTIIQIA